MLLKLRLFCYRCDTALAAKVLSVDIFPARNISTSNSTQDRVKKQVFFGGLFKTGIRHMEVIKNAKPEFCVREVCCRSRVVYERGFDLAVTMRMYPVSRIEMMSSPNPRTF